MTRLNVKPPRSIPLAFWSTLAAAIGLYALVLLAPDWLTLGDLGELEAEHGEVETALEDRIEYLEQIRDSLRDEPGYATELARLDAAEVRPNENRLTVSESLRLAQLPAVSSAGSEPPGEWAARPAVAALAHNGSLRTTLLVVAAVMVLFAFTALQESHAERLARWGNLLRPR